MKFELHSPYQPAGDQPQAIDILTQSLQKGNRHQTLLGITGSGKTFTMANIIQNLQRPTLIVAHNKTLAAQLAQEFKEFFPKNAVHYFVSYYDYYQPEAYIQKTDTYIEKDSSINEEIDRLRHAATESLITRKDVIIVASVSCIYGIGAKQHYLDSILEIQAGQDYEFEQLIEQLIFMQFERAGQDFKPGMFHVLGDVLEIFPASQETAYTLEFFGNYLEKITRRNTLTGEEYEQLDSITLFPAAHTVTPIEHLKSIVPTVKEELEDRITFFKKKGDVVAAERIKTKTEFDLEMMLETGYVKGIENYSRYLDGRPPGMPPETLVDFFPDDFITFIDESHITLSQIGGMYAGDRSRKDMLVEHGFRLPSAYDNRPLFFEEFEKKVNQFICVSATPGDSEIEQGGVLAEQIIRPTGLLDPKIEIEDMEGMVDHVLDNIRQSVDKNERALITTLTKKSSEDLTSFLLDHGVKAAYLHSEIDTIERLEILKKLRTGETQVIVGVNLLREGLDLPEVSFIGILDADKQGFLRSARSLIQTIGRAARNANGKVIMYSYKKNISPAMEEAIDITHRRRKLQQAHNKKHGITPKTVVSSIKEIGLENKKTKKKPKTPIKNLEAHIKKLELEMDLAATSLDFEKAATLRDEILELKKK